MKTQKQKIIVVLGPTASGKSDLSVKIAKRFNGEVISADSRQVYKGLDIGSGKITKKEMRGVPHYCLSYTSPKRTHTVHQYKKYAKWAISKIVSRNKLPIICGGTGFYIDSVVYDQTIPEVKPNWKLRKKLEGLGTEAMYKKLKKLDPGRAKTIDRQNPRRLVRALEIVMTTKQQIPTIENSSPYEVLWLGIKIPEMELKKRIHHRLMQRMREGLVKEVKNLHAMGLSFKRLYDLGLEYRYGALYLESTLTKKEMAERLEKEIWRYAKRQNTWYKRNAKICWITNKNEAARLVRKFCYNSSGDRPKAKR